MINKLTFSHAGYMVRNVAVASGRPVSPQQLLALIS
jgi:hypothetical protein